MRTALVKSRMPLPDMPRGVVVRVEMTPRVEGLIASGKVELVVGPKPVEQEPASPVPPSGTITAVLDWVGDDPERALAAMEAELDSARPRQTLLDRLDALSASDAFYGAEEPAEGEDTGGEPAGSSDELSAPEGA